MRIWIITLLLMAGMLWGLPASVLSQQDSEAGLTIHVVQRGENLFRIALSYGLTTDQLAEANGIANVSSITVGQRLLVPIENVTLEPQVHIVQAGETLQSIAELYEKTSEELAELNALDNINWIFVGQELVIVPESKTSDNLPAGELSSASAEGVTLVHTVQAGETLFRIGLQYNLTVNALATANNLIDPTRIFAGQQLIISGVDTPQLAIELPDPISNLSVLPLVFIEGETGWIQLTSSVPTTLTGTFLGHELAILSLDNNTQHTIPIGIPIFTQPGIYPVQLQIVDNTGTQIPFTFNMQVVGGNYGSQTIEVTGEKAELLAPAVEENELNLMIGATSNITADRQFGSSLGLPAAAPMNGPFGTRRSYNGGAFDQYHRGIDFAGAPGMPVLAAAPGKIVLADTLHIRGLTTVIDHGWGIFTVYAHQNEQAVQVGETVQTGQIIGTIGSTGRTTGAHLHWEVWVNGTPVNPIQWVQTTFP